MPIIIWMDFKTDNPTIADEAKERALSINKEPGFLWKIWTKDAANDRPGGIYCFDTLEHAEDYILMHKKRLTRSGAKDIQYKIMNVVEDLTQITHGPI